MQHVLMLNEYEPTFIGIHLWMPFSPSFYGIVGDGSKPWYLVNPKIAGKWMFIPLKCIYRYLWNSFLTFQNLITIHDSLNHIESQESQVASSSCRRVVARCFRSGCVWSDSVMILNEGSGRAAELFSRRSFWVMGGLGENPLNFMGKYWNMFNNSYSWWCYVSNFQIGHNYFQLWLGMDKNGNIMGIEWIWLFQPLASGYSHTWTIRIRTMGYSLVMTQPWPFQAWTNGITMTITGI